MERRPSVDARRSVSGGILLFKSKLTDVPNVDLKGKDEGPIGSFANTGPEKTGLSTRYGAFSLRDAMSRSRVSYASLCPAPADRRPAALNTA